MYANIDSSYIVYLNLILKIVDTFGMVHYYWSNEIFISAGMRCRMDMKSWIKSILVHYVYVAVFVRVSMLVHKILNIFVEIFAIEKPQ